MTLNAILTSEEEITRIARSRMESPFPLTSGYYLAYEMMLEKEKERVRVEMQEQNRAEKELLE